MQRRKTCCREDGSQKIPSHSRVFSNQAVLRRVQGHFMRMTSKWEEEGGTDKNIVVKAAACLRSMNTQQMALLDPGIKF